MYNLSDEELFAQFMAGAFDEEIEEMMKDMPSEEELERLYPFTKRQERELRRLLRIVDRKNRKHRFIYIKRAAVIFLCILTASFGLLMTDEGVRAAIGKAINEVAVKVVSMLYHADMDDVIKEHNDEEGYYSIAFDDITVADREEAEKEFSIENVEVTYIPEGFELCESEEDEKIKSYIYTHENGRTISVSVMLSNTTDFYVDSERTENEKISVKGKDAFVFYNQDEMSGSIYFGNEIYVCSIYGNISREELIMVAEGVEY